jgi:hypothetical protein
VILRVYIYVRFSLFQFQRPRTLGCSYLIMDTDVWPIRSVGRFPVSFARVVETFQFIRARQLGRPWEYQPSQKPYKPLGGEGVPRVPGNPGSARYGALSGARRRIAGYPFPGRGRTDGGLARTQREGLPLPGVPLWCLACPPTRCGCKSGCLRASTPSGRPCQRASGRRP